MKIFLKNNGSVSVFLSLLLIPVILFACIAVDAIRINGARAIAYDATDLALKTAMCDYDRILYDVYGLLAISSNQEELSSNLVKYYENTINSLSLDINHEDSYTQAILQDIRNSILSVDDIEFNNIIDMTCTDFNMSCVEGSELYNTEVAKRQIVEYMKYRGILSIGEGFINKIKIFDEVPAQQQTIEKKGNYDSALCDLQSVCQEVYDDINFYVAYEDELDGYNIQKFIDESMYGVKSADKTLECDGIQSVNRMIKAINRNDYVVYSDIDDRYVHEKYPFIDNYLLNTTTEIIEFISKYENAEKSDEIVDYYLAIMQKSAEIKNIFLYNSVVDAKFEEYKNEIIARYMAQEAARMSAAMCNNIPYCPLPNYELEAALIQYSNLKSFMSDKPDILHRYIETINKKDSNIKEIADQKIKQLNDHLLTKYNLIEKIVNTLNKIKENLLIIRDDYLPQLKIDADEWKTSIDNLSDGDIKTNIKSQYYDATKNINRNHLNDIIIEINRILDYYSNELYLAENISYYDMYACCEKINHVFSNICNDSAAFSEANKSTIYNYADNELAGKTIHPSLTGYSIYTADIEKDDFYQYLHQNCVHSKSQTKEEKDRAKEQEKSIMNIVHKSNSDMEQFESEQSTANAVPDSGEVYEDLATVILQSIADIEVEASENIDTDFNADNVSKSKKLIKKTNSDTNGQVANVGGIGEFLENLAEDGRDNLLTVEYMTEMFSCLTTNKKSNGSDEKTLAGINMNHENNYIFGGEQEYILWGKNGSDTNKNITYTLSSIYGLRFVLNTIYAYTDVEIMEWTMSLALALAGWTGFGVPIVQNVLILVLAMGETAIDLVRLMSGESVVVYKSYSSWVLKPSGIGNTAVEYVKSSLEDSVDKLLDKVEQLSIDFTDQKVQELNSAIDDYADEISDSIISSITSSIITPLQAKLDIIINKAMTEPIDKINQELDEIYNNLKLETEKEEDSITKTVKLLVIDEFINEGLVKIKGQLSSLPGMIESKVSEARTYIEKLISDTTSKIADQIKDELINNGYDKIKETAKEKISEIKGNVKEKANKVIDDFTSQVSTNLYKPKQADVTSQTGSKSNISMITMNYKEYVKLFMLSGICVGKDEKYVTRMMDLIKLNLTCSSKYGDNSFRMGDLSTMLKVYTKTRVETTFMNYKLFDNPLDENRYYIEVNSLYGY